MNNTEENSPDAPSPEQKLAILSNELATPLAIIQGCAAILKKHYEAENL